MIFIVQDLLDYAQIRSGKFRKNYVEFNLRDAIDKVMCIQKKDAKDKGIDFYAEYENMAETGSSKSDLRSPIICLDEQRVMQVLLGL